MCNMSIMILNTIFNESEDFSKLINDLTGGYVANDLTVGLDGVDLEVPVEHPHKNLTPPDFSGHITFAHFVDGYSDRAGVSNLKINTTSTSKAWNVAFALAKENNYSHLVILNNVNSINPHTISLAIEAHPNKDLINISDGGAFIVKCSSDFNANEAYNVWFADNEIIKWAITNNSYAGADRNFIEFSQSQISPLDLISIEIDADVVTSTSP